jgi:type IV fimbrial biogenesis protein FimT
MKKVSGFSLVELMVTLSVMAILLGYGLPNFSGFMLNNYLDTERIRLTTSMTFARSYAINSQKYTVVCPSISGESCDADSNWHNGWIVFIDENRNRELDATDEILRFENPMKTQISATSSVYRSKIRYDGTGFSPGTNVTITFCDDRGIDYAKNLIINNSGRVRQSDANSGNVCTR